MGQQFIVRTDHCNLKHLWEQTISAPQQERWLIKHMVFDFLAHALSRKHEEEMTQQQFKIRSQVNA